MSNHHPYIIGRWCPLFSLSVKIITMTSHNRFPLAIWTIGRIGTQFSAITTSAKFSSVRVRSTYPTIALIIPNRIDGGLHYILYGVIRHQIPAAQHVLLVLRPRVASIPQFGGILQRRESEAGTRGCAADHTDGDPIWPEFSRPNAAYWRPLLSVEGWSIQKEGRVCGFRRRAVRANGV